MWDAIVIGGGHNGVIAAITLARHGARVAIVDKNPWLGGLAGGSPGGMPASLYAYAIGLVPSELDEWLGLLDGILHKPEPSWVEVDADEGEVYFRWWRDRSMLSMEAIEMDLAGLPLLLDLVSDFWRCFKGAGLYYTPSPPSPSDAAAEIDGCSSDAASILERSVRDILWEYLRKKRWFWTSIIYPSMFESNGFALAYYLQNRGVWDQPIGGMRSLAARLEELARRSGVDLVLGRRVVDLVMENGRVRGVVLDGGERMEARRAVVYSAPIYTLPRLPTAENLLGEDRLKELRRMGEQRVDVRRIDYIVSKRPTPPREDGWRGQPIISSWSTENPRVGGEFTYPSLYSNMEVHLVQASGPVDPLKPLPPGVEEDDIVAWWLRGADTQRVCCGNTTGHPDHIPLRDPYIMDGRPLPGWHDYTTDIPGLYHASASSYPGGEINGVAGHNAAVRILLDVGVAPRTPLYKGSRGRF